MSKTIGIRGSGLMGSTLIPGDRTRSIERAIRFRGPAALQALLQIYQQVKGQNLSQISHCASFAYDLRVRRAASLLLNPESPDRLKTFLQLVPKAILHVHLDGSVKPQTVFELAQEKGIDLREAQPALPENYTVADLEKFMRIPQGEKVKDFWDFLLKSFGLPLAVMQDREGIERISEELVEQAYEDGALHVEVRFAPCVHLRGKPQLSYEEVIESVMRGLSRGARKYGISFTATPAIYRDKINARFGDEHKDSPAKTTEAVLNVWRGCGGKVPLAFDLVGFETPYPPEMFKDYYEKIFQAGIPITVHAGENMGAERNILTAVRELHAKRIGHGIHALRLSEKQQELIRGQIALEVCPTMNVQLECIEGGSIEKHPVRKLIEKGFRVTINPDNITISGVTVSDELLVLNRYLDLPIFGENQMSRGLISLMSNSAEAAFVSPARRKALRQEFLAYYQALNQLLELVPLAGQLK